MDKIIDTVKDVFEHVGSVLRESCYNKCMALKLRLKFDVVQVEKSVPIMHMNHQITVCRADIVADNLFIVDLHAVKNKFSDNDLGQLKGCIGILKIES